MHLQKDWYRDRCLTRPDRHPPLSTKPVARLAVCDRLFCAPAHCQTLLTGLILGSVTCTKSVKGSLLMRFHAIPVLVLTLLINIAPVSAQTNVVISDRV